MWHLNKFTEDNGYKLNKISMFRDSWTLATWCKLPTGVMASFPVLWAPQWYLAGPCVFAHLVLICVLHLHSPVFQWLPALDQIKHNKQFCAVRLTHVSQIPHMKRFSWHKVGTTFAHRYFLLTLCVHLPDYRRYLCPAPSNWTFPSVPDHFTKMNFFWANALLPEIS